MNSEIGLTTSYGEEIALQSVAINATLTGVLTEVEITQKYHNNSGSNIETVYTFPLPIDAVLTSLHIELNGEVLQGQVKANQAAEQEYEDAIIDGDTAVLLSKISDGLYCINLGNLLAGGTAAITVCYAQINQWQGDKLRFYLPTTIAPKYGLPQLSKIAEHQMPQHSLSASYTLSFSMAVKGLLAGTHMTCPTHQVTHRINEQVMHISLTESQPMDRDFVLLLDKPKGYIGEGCWANDGEKAVTLTSVIPQPEDIKAQAPQPKCIKIVVDCSGSMSGDSIKQARIALKEIIKQFNADDYFNIILFGSNHQMMFDKAVIADRANTNYAIECLQNLDANLGGTEILSALRASYRCHSPTRLAKEILLITDGQIWDEEPLLNYARLAEHRHFVVGVGSAVSEPFLSKLARVTGGASEFVSPNEDMSKRILQHFRRMKSMQLYNPQLCISDKYLTPLCFDPVPPHKSTLYLGDTVNLFNLYEGYPPAKADFYFESVLDQDDEQDDIECNTIALTHKDDDTGLLARLAAHDRLLHSSEKEATQLALQYQLLSKFTSYILVKTHANAGATTLPKLQHIVHEQPAGQSGFGSVTSAIGTMFKGVFGQQKVQSPIDCPPQERFDDLDSLDFLREDNHAESMNSDCEARSPIAPKCSVQNIQYQSLAACLNVEFTVNDGMGMSEFDIIDLDERGEDEAIIDLLYQLEELGIDEQKLVAAWLSLYNEFNPNNPFNRHVSRLIKVLCRELDVNERLIELVKTNVQSEIVAN